MAAIDPTPVSGFEDGQTLYVRGSGGAESLVDVPTLGTQRREQFDGLLAAGLYVVLDDAPEVDESGAYVAPGDRKKTRRGAAASTDDAAPKAEA